MDLKYSKSIGKIERPRLNFYDSISAETLRYKIMNYSIPLKYYIVISIIVMSIESFLCIFYGKYYFRGWHNAEIEDIIFHVIVTMSLIYYYKKEYWKR